MTGYTDNNDLPPMLDDDSSRQLAELVAKGAGGTLFLETDDCQAAYDDLSARGVVFNDPPTPQPYGIDTSFRDPTNERADLTLDQGNLIPAGGVIHVESLSSCHRRFRAQRPAPDGRGSTTSGPSPRAP